MALPEKREPDNLLREREADRLAERRSLRGARILWWWLWIIAICLVIWWAAWGWGGTGGWWRGHRVQTTPAMTQGGMGTANPNRTTTRPNNPNTGGSTTGMGVGEMGNGNRAGNPNAGQTRGPAGAPSGH